MNYSADRQEYSKSSEPFLNWITHVITEEDASGKLSIYKLNGQNNNQPGSQSLQDEVCFQGTFRVSVLCWKRL